MLFYVPFFYILFTLLDIRNKYLPGFSKVKITFFLFVLFYGLSSFVGEFVSYAIHRILHLNYFFQFHKEHHMYISPFALSSIDCHPIEIFFWNLLPTFTLGLIIGLNKYIIYILAISGIIAALFSHCGYRVVDFGFFNNAHHDLHHERMKCNYSTPFVDYVMGTYLYREPENIYPRFDKSEKDISESVNTLCK